MYQYLHKYFSLNRTLTLPGIGSFYAETQSANLDFINKTLLAPVIVIHYKSEDAIAEEKFYNFLSKESGLNKIESTDHFNFFTTNLKQQLETGTELKFQGIGTLLKNEDGFLFKQDEALRNLFPVIAAERVIRLHAEHNIRVGEDDKTSTEMHAHLAKREVKKDQWWIIAIILAAVGIAAIAFYYR
ncbi:MAG TPA: hypothetical protein PLP23_22890 [Panacibacter sp.]|nr:hypothetical protein [Panacibacter sp.]